MPRTDLVLEAIRAGAQGDIQRLRDATERMISEERAKNHSEVAEKLTAALSAQPSARLANPRLPPPVAGSARSGDPSLGPAPLAERTARRVLSSVRLPASVAQSVRALITEQAQADELRANGLEPRNRVLLVGPPGNGKTSLAEAIAAELGRIFLVVRYDGLIASYLGETATRLKRVFDLARSMPCVLFFDEMDAIAKERSDANETGEIKRVLTSLLLQIDELPSTCLLIAATNHPHMLDDAVWRRFQLRLQLPQPKADEIRSYFRDAIATLGDMPPRSLNALVRALGQASYSDAEELALTVRRRAVLAKGESLEATAEAARADWLQRSQPGTTKKHSNGTETSSKTSRTSRRRPLENATAANAARVAPRRDKSTGKVRRPVRKTKKRS